MYIKACLNRQYQSLSVLPGIDILWYMGTITIMFVFLFWGFSIHFSVKNTERLLQPDRGPSVSGKRLIVKEESKKISFLK